MSQPSSSSGACAAAGIPRTSGSPRSTPVSPLRWLGSKLSGLMRWFAKRLRAPLRQVARVLMLRWAAEHLPAPLRWLAGLFSPGRERGFGFWWLVATIAVAVALGMIVALLLTPVAGLIALLVVAIWALVSRHRGKRQEREDRTSGARAPGADEGFGAPLPTGAQTAPS